MESRMNIELKFTDQPALRSLPIGTPANDCCHLDVH